MPFLIHFFNSLNASSIQYCVLRNYQSLPESTGGSDLDILINKNDSTLFFTILLETCSLFRGNLISFIPSSKCPRICVAGNQDKGWGLMIDLHYNEISYRNYTILSNTNIWRNTFQHNDNISALNSKADTLIGLFKELLNNEKCKPKYYESFRLTALDAQFIENVFSDINKPQLGKFVLNFKNIEYSEQVIAQLVKKLNKEFPKNRFSFLNHFNKIKRIFKQPGYTVAFLGTDGSGKSTIIENIKNPLNDAFHNAVYYEHMRPNRLPSIARLMGKKDEFTGPVTNPHGSSNSGFLGSLFRWGYYMLDYTFGFYLKVWPKKAIRSCVWIFDRYYYDNLIDPKRGRIKLPYWILKFGQFIIPEPDIILCLGADAEAIHKRKPELPLVEVERQVVALKKFCKNNKRAVWIDTGKSEDESSKDALEAIIKVMAKRFQSVKLS